MSNVKERLDKVKEMIQEQDFLEGKGLSNEVCDYLNIDSESDIKIIIDLIKDETLNFRPIKSINYDQR